MPTNTAIPTESTGNVLPASWCNDVAVLNTAIGLFDVGSPLSGSPPPTTAPNFLVEGGTLVQSVDANSNMIITFPTAFPSGLVTVVATIGSVGPYNAVYDAATGGSGAGFAYIGIVNTTTGVKVTGSSGPYRINWIAIGF